MQVIIRPFERSDMDPLYFLDQRASPEEARTAYADLVTALLEADAMALVAVPHTEERPLPVLGTLLARHEAARQRVRVRLLLVDPAMRHQGLARRLLILTERAAQDLGARQLVVPAADDGARRFLEHLGFAPTEEEAPGLGGAPPSPLWQRAVPEGDAPAGRPAELPVEDEAAPNELPVEGEQDGPAPDGGDGGADRNGDAEP